MRKGETTDKGNPKPNALQRLTSDTADDMKKTLEQPAAPTESNDSRTTNDKAVVCKELLDGWTRDYAVLHKWDEKYFLDLGIIRCWVSRDYENHEVFGAGIGGRHGRQLKRKFQTADEAKVAAQKLAEKACKEMMAKLKPAKPSND